MRKYEGELEGFPEEIVQWMLQHQEDAGNELDVTVFEANRCAASSGGGFNWGDTKEENFCKQVIGVRNFNCFFDKYPKNNKEFIPGKWYYCSCNKNYHRFLKQDRQYFINDAIIINYHNSPSKYIKRIETKSLMIYFNPKNIVSSSLIAPHLLKESEPVLYVKCIEPKSSYTIHPKAEEYGCTNYMKYHEPEKGQIYKVIKTIIVNPEGEHSTSYIIEDNSSGQFIIQVQGTINSTKEAFDAQLKVISKPKKWDKGTYIVPLQAKLLSRPELLIAYKPYEIIKKDDALPCIQCEDGGSINFITSRDSEITEGIKWFATLKEAQKFINNKMIKINMKTPKSSARFKIGDEIESCVGGWQYYNPQQPSAIGFMESDKNIKSGECTSVIYSPINNLWWYKIGNYGNYFSESGIKFTKEFFTKGEYIVTLDPLCLNDRYFPTNYCFKQSIDEKYLKVKKDIKGTPNGWVQYSKNLKNFLWRYATNEEIVEYEQQGKPFDVTIFNKKKNIL